MCINKENYNLAIETLEKIAYVSELNEHANLEKQCYESILEYAAKIWCWENTNYVLAARETLKKIDPKRYD